MKKTRSIPAILLVIVLLCSLLPASALAAEGYTVSLAASAAEIDAGESVSVDIDVSSGSEASYNAFYAVLRYDGGIFVYDESGSTLNGFSVEQLSSGTLKISRVGTDVAVSTAPDIRLVFKAAAAGTGSFFIQSANVDAAENARQDAPAAAIGAPVHAEVKGIRLTIRSKDDLLAFSEKVKSGINYAGSTIVLAADIDLTREDYTPIGYYDESDNRGFPFSGSFDGGGHTVTLDIQSPYVGHQALFGYVAGGTIENVTVAGTVTAGGDPRAAASSAGVVAALAGGTVSGCVNLANVSGNVAGGIVGYASTEKGPVVISDCFNAGAITATGESGAGGIAGNAGGIAADDPIRLIRCGNSGTITAANTRAGGIAGISMFADVENCWNVGTVSAMNYVGGLIGHGYSGVRLENCYNAGRVFARLEASAGNGVGGLVGVTAATVEAKNVFNAGTLDGGNAGTPTGALIGSGNGRSTNAYYLASTAFGAFGSGSESGIQPVSVTLGELETLQTGLGDAFQAGAHHPVLTAQPENTKNVITGIVELKGDTAEASIAGKSALGLPDRDNQTLTVDLSTFGAGAASVGVTLSNALRVSLGSDDFQTFSIVTDAGSLSFDAATLGRILQNAGNADLKLLIEKLTQSTNQSVQELLDAGYVVFHVSLTANGSDVWGGKAVLTLPYVRPAGMNTVTLSKVSEQGTLEKLSSQYNASGKTVSAVIDSAGFFAIGASRVDSGGSGSGNTEAAVWDGLTIDVSWFDKDSYARTKDYYIRTPAQLAGLAAIVNGIYNKEIDTFVGDMTAVVDNVVVSDDASGPQGQNKSTSTYHIGSYDFNGKTVHILNDIDMSGGNYMPIGGQYLMTKNDSSTKISASFNGVFDGGGHNITIICDRHCSTGNYGDGQAVGLIGRLGCHDNDPRKLWPTQPAVMNVAVYGSVYANRSVGGIVGKTGKTTANITGNNEEGALISCCANYATIANTDSKGCGGIVGAGWNGGTVINCYNSGSVRTTYPCPTAGISGSNEIVLENCYNVGTISAVASSYAMAIGTNNGGAPYASCVINCWYLEGSAPGGGYYSGGTIYNSGARSSEDMKTEEFLEILGSAYAEDTNGINQGYPILKWQKGRPGSSSGGAGDTKLAPDFDGDTVVIYADVDHSKGGSAYAADATLTKEIAAEGLDKATDKSRLKVWVEIQDSNRLVLKIEQDAAQEIAGRNAGLRVECSRGVIEIDSAAVSIIAAAEGEARVTISYDDWYGKTRLSVTVNNVLADVAMKIELPALDEYAALAIVGSNGSRTIIKKSAVVNGRAYARIRSGTTLELVSNTKYLEDVKKDDWFAGAVDFVVVHELMQGVEKYVFAPGMPMTRAMMVTVLYRLEGEPELTGEAIVFGDVNPESWYANEVAWASATGLVYGTDLGFEPNASITREQIATILYRYARFIGLDTSAAGDLSVFSDGDKVSSWAQEAMAWAVGVGLFQGDDTGKLNPQGNATRAEVATLLMRLVKLIVVS